MPTLSINYTVPQGLRILAAVGRDRHFTDANGVLRPATVAEVQQHIREFLVNVVRTQEVEAAREALVAPPDLDLV